MISDFTGMNIENSSNKYKTIYSNIKSAVLKDAVKDGERLPSIREAANRLSVSRTTVENAYARLCIEGIAESRPNRGYFIIGTQKTPVKPEKNKPELSENIKYDFSSRRIDTAYADTESWKKLIRSVLRDSDVLTSYGEPQGELYLRKALASYSYKSRGVTADEENIVIGAGIGPLLNILCGILGRDITVGIENGNFKEAESIFNDYGIKTVPIKSDSNGAVIEDIYAKNIDVLFLMPSSLSKISINSISRRRLQIEKWLSEDSRRIVIEDDYNGELRYTARTLPAFKSKAGEKCIYIGSFSKLLLPSVRIAYMVLPKKFAEIFNNRKRYYNQTCGKTEQLALAEYISGGKLEKHLRRLRRLYYAKSQILCDELKKQIEVLKDFTLYETSLTVEIKTAVKAESQEICKRANKMGLKIMPSNTEGSVKLCFAGISQEDIPRAVTLLKQVLVNFE